MFECELKHTSSDKPLRKPQDSRAGSGLTDSPAEEFKARCDFALAPARATREADGVSDRGKREEEVLAEVLAELKALRSVVLAQGQRIELLSLRRRHHVV